MTGKEIDYYVQQLNMHPVEDASGKMEKSVQQLASLFLNGLNSEGKGSNPTAIVKIANKLKPAS